VDKRKNTVQGDRFAEPIGQKIRVIHNGLIRLDNQLVHCLQINLHDTSGSKMPRWIYRGLSQG